MEERATALEQVITVLLSQGLTSGVVIAILVFAVWKLYQRNQELHRTLYEVGRESIKSNEAVTAALNRLSDLLVRGRLPE